MKRVDISAGAILLLSVIYFFGGMTSLTALLLAVLVHELGHIAAIELCGGRVHGLKVSVSGLCINCSGAGGTLESVICLCAGPAGGFALAYAASYLGNLSQNLLLIKTAGFSLVLSVYNLLPALPLDGGHLSALPDSSAAPYLRRRYLRFLECSRVRRCCLRERILYATRSVQRCSSPECGY